MLKKLGLALFALVAAASITAYAAGNFGLWPILNGAAYCGATGNDGTCTSTIPAGPTALTGNETIPMDTNLAQGIQPQTILAQPRSLGAGPYQYAAPLTGASLTLTAQQRRLILEPAGTIAALTVVFPAATGLVDNQLMGLCTTQIVTALTLTAGSGTTILNGPTALLVPVATGAASCVEWVYRASNTSWYRVQ
jgi:hypothetical protein